MKYQTKNLICITPCPYGKKKSGTGYGGGDIIKVGTQSCSRCDEFLGFGDDHYVKCNLGKEGKLKEIEKL